MSARYLICCTRRLQCNIPLCNLILRSIYSHKRHNYNNYSSRKFTAISTNWKNDVRRTDETKSTSLQKKAEVLEAFRDALNAEDVERGIHLYPTVKLHELLDSGSFAQLARILHNRYRLSRSNDEKSKLAHCARVMVRDLQHGNAPPSPEGSLRLISFFKEAYLRGEGSRFWNWLVKQSDHHVDARVYGAAIELLALCGERLDKLEALYNQGIKRFPFSFVEYHLSPYAILSQPSQRHQIKGLSQSLLQGIITARMILGDIYGAYLGLDTALRLFDYQMLPRICHIFVQSRSIPEAYKVLLTAIRTGVRLKAPMLRVLQTRMIQWQKGTKTYSDKLQLSERALNAFYAYVASGNQLFSTNVGLLVKTLAQLINPPRPIDMGLNDYTEFRKEIRKTLCDSIFETVETMNKEGMAEPEISVYNTLISMAGRSRDRILFGRILQQIDLHDLKPDDVTYKVVLSAAGFLGDAEIVASTWNTLADTFVINDQTNLAHQNRFRLQEACKKAGCMDFYYAQVGQKSKLADDGKGNAIVADNQHKLNDPVTNLDPRSESAAAVNLGPAEQVSGTTELRNDPIPDMTPADPDEIRSRVQHLRVQMEAIRAVAHRVQRPSLYADPVSIDLTELPEAVTKITSPSRRVMRAVYEELNTDPFQSVLDRLEDEKLSKEESSVDPPIESPAVPPGGDSEVNEQATSNSSILESSGVSSLTPKPTSTNTTKMSSTPDQPNPPQNKAESEPDATSTVPGTSPTKTHMPTLTSTSPDSKSKSEPEPEPESEPESVTPTGYPLSEIRFANWLSLTELLLVARVEQKRQQAVIDRAIALGISVRAAIRTSDEHSSSKMLKDPDPVGIFDGFREGRAEEGEEEDDDATTTHGEVVDRTEVAQVKKRVAPLRYEGAGSATAAAAATAAAPLPFLAR